MKRAIAILIILTLINPPLWATQNLTDLSQENSGLHPKNNDWKEDTTENMRAVVALFREKNPEVDAEARINIENELATMNAVPVWETFKRDKERNVTIAIRYLTGEKRVVIYSFAKTAEEPEVISDEPRFVNNWIARRILGLNLPNVLALQPVLEEVKQEDLPWALVNRERLLQESPGALVYGYTLAEETVENLRNAVRNAEEKIGNPIKAVIVLGMNGQSLIERAVLQMFVPEGIRLLFPENIVNPEEFLAKELEGIEPKEVLLYVNDTADETIANFLLFWGWMMGQTEVASSLINKVQGQENITSVNLSNISNLSEEERGLLQETLSRIAINTVQGEEGALYNFAKNNNITVVTRTVKNLDTSPVQELEAKLPYEIMPFVSSSRKGNPKFNPTLEAAMYAYASNKSGRPIIALISNENRLAPLFESAQQLLNTELGREGISPYFISATGENQVQELVKAPKNKLFLAVNVGGKRINIPQNVPAIEINIPEISEKTVNLLLAFLGGFSTWYSAFLGVNPTTQRLVNRFNETLTEGAKGIGITQEAGKAEVVIKPKEFTVTGGLDIPEGLKALLKKLAEEGEVIETAPLPPQNESGFESLLNLGKYRMTGKLENLEGLAQNLALQLYALEKLGKPVSSFYINPSSPEANLVGEFIKYLGKEMARLAGGITWNHQMGFPGQHSVAQILANNTAIPIFINFQEEMAGEKPIPSIINAKGLVSERLGGMAPREVSRVYMKAVSQVLNNEGRITGTIEVPNEGQKNLGKLYLLLVRTLELYSKLWGHENKGGTKLEELVKENESVVVEPEEGVKVGPYGQERLLEPEKEPVDLYDIAVPMYIGGIAKKGFINPLEEGASNVVSSSLAGFMSRVKTLASVVSRLAGRKGSALNRFVTAEELKEPTKPEFYAFKLEDVIARVKLGDRIGDTSWREIEIKSVNPLVAKTVQEIHRINKKAKVIVYTEEPELKKYLSQNPDLMEDKFKAILNAVDCGGVFDLAICGNPQIVLSEICKERVGWVKIMSDEEAKLYTVFASTEDLSEQKLKSAVLPEGERFTPFPELAFVMQTMLRDQKLDVDSIISSYIVWLELAGLNIDEINRFKKELMRNLRRSLEIGTNLVVFLPLPPEPKPGSVMKQLDKEYKEETNTKGFA